MYTQPILAARLANIPPAERDAAVLDVLCSALAEILGLADASAVDPHRPFAGMGISSLAAVELTRQLSRASGLKLPVTLGFDYPTPSLFAKYIRRRLDGEPVGTIEPARPSANTREPVAIVGMACRLPGGVSSPEELWSLVASGQDAISPFPDDRGWELEKIWDPEGWQTGATIAPYGGFISGPGMFDAGFFAIGPREATAMDPQQRILLELVWEAFEDAGLDPGAFRGSRTGVFAGVATHDYTEQALGCPELAGYVATGTSSSVVSGRVAYMFGFEGPALTVDTACSSSLVSLHLACKSLDLGECSFAIAAGVTVMATPRVFVEFGRQGALSPDGRCKAFGARADGTGFSEGAALVLLERLADARRLGHRVLAIVPGSAINQDGASNGLTAPNGPSQERLIREALANARLSSAEIDAVEGHGTGTRLGDPVEVRALLATYGQERAPGRPLWLGSLKSNIGHTQAAAGLAGVIKMVLAMRHGVLPRTLHVEAPTPEADWPAGQVSLLKEPQEWPARDAPRRAAVSAFGMSGTNAHVILEDAPEPDEDRAAKPEEAVWDAVLPWALSAKSWEALQAQAARLRQYVAACPRLSPRDVAHSLIATRAPLEFRGIAVGGDRGELLAGLDALSALRPAENVVWGQRTSTPKVAFLFPGQGSQWHGMGRELLTSSPVFAESIGRCAEALAPFIDWPLEAVIRGDPDAPSFDRVDVVQPALFAMMVSLTALWQSFGVKPDFVMGHSQGEIAAAHIAGALSLEDASRIVALRSQKLAGIAGRGGMASVSLPIEAAQQRIASFGSSLSLAAVNGPSSVVIAGDNDALDVFVAACEAGDIWARRIPVDYASHSSHVDVLRDELLRLTASIAPQSSCVRFVSGITGQCIDTQGIDAQYWFENLRRMVRCDLAVRTLTELGCQAFVEVSPHPILTVGILGFLEAFGEDNLIVDTIRRDEGAMRRLTMSLGELYVRGVEVDWRRLVAGRRVELPAYPFQRQQFWATPALNSAAMAAAGIEATGHRLLTGAVPLAGDGWLFTGNLSVRSHPWLRDHAVKQTLILSGTTFVELALSASRHAGSAGVEELLLEKPIVVPGDGGVDLQLRIGAADDEGRRSLAFHSRTAGASSKDERGEGWTRHAIGTLAPPTRDDADKGVDQEFREVFESWPPPHSEEVEVDSLYERLEEAGYDYGPAFRSLQRMWSRGDELFGELANGEEATQAGAFLIHPALLDAGLHMLGVRLTGDIGAPQVPFAWNGVRLNQPGRPSLRIRLAPAGPHSVSMIAADDTGATVLSADNVALRALPDNWLAENGQSKSDELLVVRWREVLAPADRTESFAVAGQPVSGFPDDVDLHPDLAAIGLLAEKGALPANVIIGHPPVSGEPVSGAAHATARRTLADLQAFLRDKRLDGTRLVFVTRGAVAVRDGETPDLSTAPVWGLVRSAQSEHPGRFVLLDIEHSLDHRAIGSALALGEEQMAIRKGAVLVPRIAPSPKPVPSQAAPLFPENGTVLITGGTGTLGRLLARHLVSAHGVRHLLLVSRRGANADGAADFASEMEGRGAHVTTAACDVSDRESLQRVLRAIPSEHPLRAVIHSAGLLDDGAIESLTPERIDSVLRPKIDASWNLHELTLGLELSVFVLFSSIAGIVGGPGQGNYAAANVFLDALAAYRQAEGKPAVSMAWGLWADVSEMTALLTNAGRASLGLRPMPATDALRLFDRSLAGAATLAVPAHLDIASLRALAAAGPLPSPLRELVPMPRRRSHDSSLLKRLAAAAAAERETILLGVVLSEVASILGHASADAVSAHRSFKDQGMQSLSVITLRNRLEALTGLRLPSTLAFDRPTPAAVAVVLNARLKFEDPKPPVQVALDKIAAMLGSISNDEERRHVCARFFSEILCGPCDPSLRRRLRMHRRMTAAWSP